MTGDMIDRKEKMPLCLDWLDVVGPHLLISCPLFITSGLHTETREFPLSVLTFKSLTAPLTLLCSRYEEKADIIEVVLTAASVMPSVCYLLDLDIKQNNNPEL